MKIDYAKIIEVANARKETLQKLTALLQEQPEMLGKLNAVLRWTDAVSAMSKALDTEGRGLLPKQLAEALHYISSTQHMLSTAICTKTPGMCSGVQYWTGLEEDEQ